MTETQLDYKLSPFREVLKDTPITKVADLVKCRDRDNVSVKVFVKVSTFPEVKVNLPYLSNPIQKKEACANNGSGVIPIVLWNKHVQFVVEDGSYLVKNVVF